MRIAKRKPHKLLRLAWIALAILVAGSIGFMYYQSAGEQPQIEPKRQTDQPKTSQFADISEVPVRIMIDKIAVDAVIEPVGLTGDGLMAAPATNDLVGWYDQSARAGDDDYAMLLDGHYGSDTEPAVFRNLSQLVNDDKIKIEAQDGTVLEYKVVESKSNYAENVDMDKAFNIYRPGQQSLTIITCEGLYDPVNVSYDKRTVVYAERVK